MINREKMLYHHIHPLKLLTDWSTGCISVYLLWRRHLRTALLVQVVPALVVLSALVRWADLASRKRSAFGRPHPAGYENVCWIR